MSTGVFEIVQLPNGDYALQPAGDAGEHLLKISFSQEAKAFLGDKDVSVAKAMIGAAVKAVENIRQDRIQAEEEEQKPTTIH